MIRNKNILIIIGSPHSKKGNSEIIADSLINKLGENKSNISKLYLWKEIGRRDNALIQTIDKADIIVLSMPIYENSVPGLVLKFFEDTYQNKNKLSGKVRKFLVITNSGFPEVNANRNAMKTSKLFARYMSFIWIGGIAVAPGTLIGGEIKKNKELGGIYKRLNISLSLIAKAMVEDTDIPEEVFKTIDKAFMLPIIYRLGGRLAQRALIKQIGRNKFLAMPLN